MLDPIDLPPPRHVDIDGACVATYVIEPPDREPRGDVVLCHGTPWSSAVWAPVARRLATERRVFLWDMPGYGASIGSRAPRVDLETQRQRLGLLLEHWELTGPDVVAHDIGGAVALGAHLLESVPMASLYLLDVVTLDPWGSPFFRLVAQHQDVFAALPANLHAALVREYVAGASHGHLPAGWIEELSRPWCTPEGQRGFYRQMAELVPAHTRPIVENLGRVRCPVRIGWGERDPWIPVAQAARLAELLPGPVDVFTIPEAGHLVPVEASELLTDDIVTWLRHVGAGR
ncbi:alpha/beta hydrolase [Aeromicrobium sp. Root495]|uniref:alpha/beta fold hydrolase n=1 Tax=Aeromicrobium sp. Root495 TaxID=1736550 RepID=UPI0007003E69|nr:alpha/beta hydrolase [Aeromicrobium sp. Root495]KQY55316.1 alpha/beta hydrolase [Aeromicrobium sp. Root495]